MNPPPFPYRRIIIVGVTGSGKTTLARQVAARLGTPHVELDALHWRLDWEHAPDDELRRLVETATRPGAWVVDGNYSMTRDITWPRAQAVVWLDLPLGLVFWRLVRRILSRWWTKELMWGINRETLWVHFKLWSDDSLIRWLFKTYLRRRRQYPALFSLPQNSHLHVVRLTTPRQVEAWLDTLPEPA
ncbi:MAG: AAA family ATPase [Chloroflexi bacterium]|nr:AAA family ATPase [Chloroflexota bacterium]